MFVAVEIGARSTEQWRPPTVGRPHSQMIRRNRDRLFLFFRPPYASQQVQACQSTFRIRVSLQSWPLKLPLSAITGW